MAGRGVSRRDGLKAVGAAGAAVALAGALSRVQAAPQKPATNAVDVAIDRFSKGHSCAQAVFSAVAEQQGMDYQTAVKVSAGFGGGMMLNSTCGAVTGAIMALGLKHGGMGADALRTPKVVKQFAAKFKARHKSVACTDLIGIDLSTFDVSNPEAIATAYKEAQAKAAFKNCADYVRDATTILTELLAEAPK